MRDREWLPLHEPAELQPITLTAEQWDQLTRDGYLILDGRPVACLHDPTTDPDTGDTP